MMIYCGIDGQRGEYTAMDRRGEEEKRICASNTYHTDMMGDES